MQNQTSLPALQGGATPEFSAEQIFQGEFKKYLAERWDCYGLIDTLVVDNGLDLLASSVSAACFAMGTEVLYMPPRVPWYKGTIESFGKTINVQVLHWLPGTTLGKVLKDVVYDPKESACVTFEELQNLIQYYVVEIHNRTPRQRKTGIPIEKWRDGIVQYPPRMPASAEEFDAAVALTKSAKVSQKGIIYEGLQYNNAALGKIWNRLGASTEVIFKVNPVDLNRIFVIDPATDAPVSVECTTPFEYPPLLDWHLAIRKQARADGLDPSKSQHLAQAWATLQAAIEDAVTRGKSSLRRKVVALAHSGQQDGPRGVQSAPKVSKQVAREDLAAVFSASEEIE